MAVRCFVLAVEYFGECLGISSATGDVSHVNSLFCVFKVAVWQWCGGFGDDRDVVSRCVHIGLECGYECIGFLRFEAYDSDQPLIFVATEYGDRIAIDCRDKPTGDNGHELASRRAVDAQFYTGCKYIGVDCVVGRDTSDRSFGF